MYHDVTVIGNLGKDPELRYLPSGTAVTSFSVASTRKYYDSNKTLVAETTWFRISIFGNRAETANQYLHKGSKVFIRGVLRPDPKTGGPRQWEHEGKWYTSFEVVADELKFLDRKGEGGSEDSESEKRSGPVEPQYVDDSGIPF